jgi:hypothetical protein
MKRKNHEKKPSTIAPLLPVISPVITNGIERPVNSRQMAEHLQITTRTLANYRAKGRIPFWKLNARNFRYRISAVEMALANAR